MYSVSVEGKECQVLVTHHALGRIGRWGLEVESVIKALLKPNEVVTGHHSRFIAHRPTNEHLIRIIYEYDEGIPVGCDGLSTQEGEILPGWWDL